jgi:aspartate aminotransferase
MRKRIAGLRHEAVKQLTAACPERDFGFIARQQGMFSFLGVTTPQVHALRERHHVYMTDDSRINVAGLRADNIEYFAKAVAQVLRA